MIDRSTRPVLEYLEPRIALTGGAPPYPMPTPEPMPPPDSGDNPPVVFPFVPHVGPSGPGS